jgi:hypothetical protein
MDIRDFPFDISDVVTLLNLNIRRSRNSRIDVDCPLCGDKRGKTTVYLGTDTFRCHHCGEGGGMLALYAKAYNISNSDAYREICGALNNGMKKRGCPGAKKKEVIHDICPQGTESAGPEERHQTYSLLFSSLNLSKTHRGKLTDRGLTAGQIEKHGFRSIPSFGVKNLVKMLIKQGCTVRGVPGFYIDETGEWNVKFSAKNSGIIIPVTTVEGYVSGAQIRLDNPFKGCKYMWLTSAGEKMGSSSGSPVGFAGDPAAETVYITEGYLKAIIAHSLTGKSFAGVAGANQYRSLAPLFGVLKRNGTKGIAEVYDMDKYANEQVEKGCLHMCGMAKDYGFTVHRIKWDSAYKGIDDYLYAVKTKKTRIKEAARHN